MQQRQINGLYGTFSIDDAPRPQRTRASLFPTQQQVASMQALQAERAAAEQPDMDFTATFHETSPEVDATESSEVDMANVPPSHDHDVDMTDAVLPHREAPVYSSIERRSILLDESILTRLT
jgi:hypothetical protein